MHNDDIITNPRWRMDAMLKIVNSRYPLVILSD